MKYRVIKDGYGGFNVQSKWAWWLPWMTEQERLGVRSYAAREFNTLAGAQNWIGFRRGSATRVATERGKVVWEEG